MSSLYIAATGMHAQQSMIEVISNNIANSNTTSFKRHIPQFHDLPYIDKSRVSYSEDLGDEGNMIPVGFQTGLGVEVVATNRIHTQGSLLESGRELDNAIYGKGYFMFLDEDGEVVYSRDGAFQTNADGALVSTHGYLLAPEITIPDNVTQIIISKSGEVQIATDESVEPIVIGQIELALFPNENGLHEIGGNLYKETNISGDPIILRPGEHHAGEISQGYLESSNSDPVQMMTNLLRAQRIYEMCSKAFQVGADVQKQINNIQT